ncbi:thioesterase-like superfamily-domain-containing protein [Hypoxylon trugodes]|uniref:thioesterase-like superfamily-domain-containing protein n=1 Tax=Hypoxylon trugodes TaxID=326681 RepID=UPI0021921F6F|nr:thioesterase-like superfamily-domain-containing protein [Hypoxylon trugodes]KAI1390665.1 thioesterase-like superfamily-domain-containing protein [Hypoxylon trugodes]
MPTRPRIKPIVRILSSPIPRQLRTPLGASSHLSSGSYTCRIGPFPTSRTFSSEPSSEQALPAPSGRWYADLRARLGKCIMFGCSQEQARRAAGVLQVLGTEWRELTAGSEGFLTGRRRGLENQQVVWGEMDSFSHINNTHYLRYAESARVNWTIHFASVDPSHSTQWRELMKPTGIGLILKAIKAEYKLPMTYPDTFSAYHKLRTQPSASDPALILDCIILSHRHRRVAARTEEDIVIYNYRAGHKTAIPTFALEVFRDVWRQQEDVAKKARAHIWQLVKEVEALEKDTWNREDAVEDLGSGKKG